ncbi:hypothetical protein L6452_04438 [Arctium lappa]|uniref:Uncharacterized protein n=1 Tax=Arctium lappa TaxID=4217 RepID=A0ACB9EDV5_ARCLA|nr:hypothetical protein L6452_04438 [Arctium lappa]
MDIVSGGGTKEVVTKVTFNCCDCAYGEDDISGGGQGNPVPSRSYADLIRMSSLPVKTEEEWRKRNASIDQRSTMKKKKNNNPHLYHPSILALKPPSTTLLANPTAPTTTFKKET